MLSFILGKKCGSCGKRSRELVSTVNLKTVQPVSAMVCKECHERLKEKAKSTEVRNWFTDPSKRGGPNAPSDFSLDEIPRSSPEEWSTSVADDPLVVLCTEANVSELGRISHLLFEKIKIRHDLDSRDAVKLFDEYLGAACPKCYGGITGNMLQMVGAGSNMAAVAGGGDGFQRLLNGQCGTCDSRTYRVVWHGDKNRKKAEPSKKNMDEHRRREIYREHDELARSLMMRAAMMGVPQDVAIPESVGKAATEMEKKHGISEDQFIDIYKEGGVKGW